MHASFIQSTDLKFGGVYVQFSDCLIPDSKLVGSLHHAVCLLSNLRTSLADVDENKKGEDSAE